MRSICAPLLALGLAHLTQAVWPIPSSISLGNSTLWFVSSDSQVRYEIVAGDLTRTSSDGYSSSNEPSATIRLLKDAYYRARNTILKHGYVPWRFHPRNADFEPALGTGGKINLVRMLLNVEDAPQISAAKNEDVDESYTLTVSIDGEVTIMANSSIGIMHGLTTFSQLFFKSSTIKHMGYTPYAPINIYDSPKFSHRGLNMDVARSIFPVKSILHQIDALAYNKMNRLHLHITDAQAWPLEIPSMPELSEKGAYNRHLVYSPDDVDRIQKYGAARGVQVYIEIDMPGHTSSIWYSHPDLIASFNMQPEWNKFAAEPPSGTLKLNEPKVSEFITKLFNDLMPRISGYSAYYHTGGDEVNKNAYLNDETVKSNDTKVIQPLLQKFVDHVHDLTRAAGFVPIVWEELLLDWNLKLGKDVIVQTWQQSDNVRKSVEQGYKTLVGNYFFWYLDCGRGQWINFPPGQSSESFWPYEDYCAPVHNWRVMYSFDPLQNINKSVEHLVVGGEVHAWAEQIDSINIDRILWPRAAAAAEVLWSGAKDPVTGQNRSQIEAAPRLADLRERLVGKGVNAEPINMPFCTMESGQCDWPTG